MGVPCLQPHTQLLCVTTKARGVVQVSTGAGMVSGAYYDSAALLQQPIVYTVSPAVWSTTEPTQITISGERYVLDALQYQCCEVVASTVGTDRAPQARTLYAKGRPVTLSGVLRFALEANSLSSHACCVMVCHGVSCQVWPGA